MAASTAKDGAPQTRTNRLRALALAIESTAATSALETERTIRARAEAFATYLHTGETPAAAAK